MLVLSRRLNEKLLIPCIRTAVQVLSIQGGQVRLGIEAPAEVAVFREEIYKGDVDGDAPPGAVHAEVQLERLRGALRNRIAGLALGLERVHRQTEGKLAPAAQAALEKLADEVDDLARILKVLLEEDDAPKGKQAAGCAR